MARGGAAGRPRKGVGKMQSLSWRVAPAVLCGLAAGVAYADQFTDPNDRFVIDLPAGWVQEPPENTKARDEAAAYAVPDRTWRYVGSFVPSGELTERSPYIIVQWTEVPLHKTSWKQLERELSAEKMDETMEEVSGRLESLVGSVEIGRPVLDRARNRTVMRMSMDTLEGRREMMSIGYLGQDGIAQIHCYAAAGELDRYAPEFDAVLSGFRYRPGEAYTGEGGGIDWSKVLRSGVIWGVGFGILALIAAATRKDKSRGGRRRSRGDAPPRASRRKRRIE